MVGKRCQAGCRPLRARCRHNRKRNQCGRAAFGDRARLFEIRWCHQPRHPVFAPRYVSIIRGAELTFMTLAEMRQGALDAKGTAQVGLAEAYLADLSALNSDDLLCSTWAQNNAKDYRHLGNLQLVSAAG